MKVRIDAGGREVEIETADANTTVADVTAQALGAWKETEGADRPREGSGLGFTMSGAVTGVPERKRLVDIGEGEQLPVRACEHPTRVDVTTWNDTGQHRRAYLCNGCGKSWTEPADS